MNFHKNHVYNFREIEIKFKMISILFSFIIKFLSFSPLLLKINHKYIFFYYYIIII